MRRGAALALLAIALASPAVAQTVTDGDTIKLDGTIYRLWGMDAPESKRAAGERERQGAGDEELFGAD